MQQVVKHYGNQINFICHMYPLPYHRNAFLATQAGLVIEALNGNSTWWEWYLLIPSIVIY